MSENNNSLKVWGWQYPPYSTDPLEYDDVVHHITWTSVFGTLVSLYKNGQVAPQIAESWGSFNGHKEWFFKIRPNCYSENGDLITPAIIAASLKRAAFLQRKNNSLSGFTEDLVGIEKLRSVQDCFPGVSYNSDTIFLKFNVPKENLLRQIAFGLYSIVHPSQYNQDGQWIDRKMAISSGAYKIKTWEKDKIQLALNEKQIGSFCFQPNPISNIDLSFGVENIDTLSQSIIVGSSKSLVIDDSFEFWGPADSDIMYIRLYKNLPPEVSVAIRNAIIYEFSQLPNIPFSLNKSFLPPSIIGISSNKIEAPNDNSSKFLKGLSLRVPIYEHAKKSSQMMNMLSYSEAFSKVMSILESKYQMNIIFASMNNSNFGDIKSRSYYFDLEMLLTGVKLEDPADDVRFMFKSKEGIQLPDRDGTIEPLLGDTSANLSLINQKIWDQGIIVPLTHFSSGLWVKRNLLDMRELNLSLPPTNFQFIGFQ